MKFLSNRKGFTLIELLVVIGILALITGALSVSISKAQQRARIAKAKSEVGVVSQSILAYENFDQNYELPTLDNEDADVNSIGFLIGEAGTSAADGKIPGILMAQLRNGGKMLDPWNTPYKISIKPGSESVTINTAASTLQTGYFYPNFYRMSEEERK